MGARLTRNQSVRFTKRKLKELQDVPPDQRTYVYDEGQDNLAVCITPVGSAIFYWMGRFQGRPIRAPLGKFPDMTVEQARGAARVARGKVSQGIDPRRQKPKKDSVEKLFNHWLVHAKQHKKSWPDDVRMFEKYFGRLKNKRLSEVTQADVAQWHTKLGEKHGPYQANRCRALLSAIWGKAPELGHNGRNPCEGVKRFREASRERFLQREELEPFFRALKAEPPVYRDFWLLCLFSGARRGNVAAMAWQDVDLVEGVWYLAGEVTKNGEPVAIVLPPPGVGILQLRVRDRNGCPWVFPAPSKSGHVEDPRKSWARVLKASKIQDLRPHDLRRSLGSWQTIQGASLQVVGASLGHRDLKSTQVYSRLQLDPVRTSVNQAVAEMIRAGKYLEAGKGKDDGED